MRVPACTIDARAPRSGRYEPHGHVSLEDDSEWAAEILAAAQANPVSLRSGLPEDEAGDVTDFDAEVIGLFAQGFGFGTKLGPGAS